MHVLWIRTGFNADRDPALYVTADPDQNSGTQTIADPEHGQILGNRVIKRM
jgi:hypothetical protein